VVNIISVLISTVGVLALFYWLGLNWEKFNFSWFSGDRESAWKFSSVILRVTTVFTVISILLVFWGASGFEQTESLKAFTYGAMLMYVLGLIGVVAGLAVFLRTIEGKWVPSWYLDSILWHGAKDMPKKKGEFLSMNKWLEKK